MRPRIGSLFSGYGGLDLAVEQVTGSSPAWFCEFDPAPSKILAHHWPTVPNLGDITAVDWTQVEPVDIVTGGSPCQDLSHAGARRGMTEGTRSNLWVAMREAIAALRPRTVVWENVRGAYSAAADSALEPCPGCVGDGTAVSLRALGRVLGDLADLGFDCRWHGIRAADVGAPHGRFRVFIVATNTRGEERARRTRLRPPGTGTAEQRRTRPGDGAVIAADTDDVGCGRLRPRGHGAELAAVTGDRRTVADTSGDGWHEGRPESAGIVGGPDATECGSTAADTIGGGRIGRSHQPQRVPVGGVAATRSGADTPADADLGGLEVFRWQHTIGRDPDRRSGADIAWGQYEPAIRRWERTLGRPAPAPTEPGPRGGQRLAPQFVEWMMGLPAGWVVDTPGISRNDQLKALGNGVVPQQAAAAIRHMATAVAA